MAARTRLPTMTGTMRVRRPDGLLVKLCKVEGCDRKHSYFGYCGMHAMRYRKHGDPLKVLPRGHLPDGRTCSYDGCTTPLCHSNKSGLCRRHMNTSDRRKAALLRDARKRKGLPNPSRPCPTLCERPGCIRPAKCLDHDHKTGAFRGWLCSPCNRALGLLGDTLDAVRGAVRYLSVH